MIPTTASVKKCTGAGGATLYTLDEKRILIAEDEPVVAFDLRSMVERAGGKVTGLAAACHQALDLVAQHQFDAAILDFNLTDRDSTPVAEALESRGTPFLFYTGGGVADRIRQRWPDIPILLKPSMPSDILGALDQLL